jgi:hypothetical protein
MSSTPTTFAGMAAEEYLRSFAAMKDCAALSNTEQTCNLVCATNRNARPDTYFITPARSGTDVNGLDLLYKTIAASFTVRICTCFIRCDPVLLIYVSRV